MSTIQRNVFASLEQIRCIDEADGWGKGEPYLWTIFIKLGGDEIRQSSNDPDRLVGTPYYAFGQGSHGNIGGGMDANDTREIPSIVGSFGASICTIELELLGNLIEIPGVIGVIAVLMEEDNISDDGAEAGHQALNQLVVSKVNSFISNLNLSDIFIEAFTLVQGTNKSIEAGAIEVLKNKFEELKNQLINDGKSVIKNAIKGEQNIFENLWSWINGDDFVDSKMFLFTMNELIDNNNEAEISERFKEGDGDYVITGKITMTSPIIPIGRLPNGIDRLEVKAISIAYSYHHDVDYITYVGGEENGEPWILHKYVGAKLIQKGIKSFYVKAKDGSETEILAAEHPESHSLFMRTSPNDTTEDNLLSLPKLSFYSEE